MIQLLLKHINNESIIDINIFNTFYEQNQILIMS